jgi:hypothetical protein
MGQCCASPAQSTERPDEATPPATQRAAGGTSDDPRALARASSSAVHRARAEAALAEVDALRAQLAEERHERNALDESTRENLGSLKVARHADSGSTAGEPEPWTKDLQVALAQAAAAMSRPRTTAEACAKLTAAQLRTGSADDGTAQRLFDQALDEMMAVSTTQPEQTFPIVFERCKIALKLWSSIPNDEYLSGEWNMAPDRRIADRVIQTCGPVFAVVWWRVILALGYIPRSDQANEEITIPIYQIEKQEKEGKEGEKRQESDEPGTAPTEWEEVPEAAYYRASTGRRKRIVEITCKVRMTLDEANAAVLRAGLNGVVDVDSKAYLDGDLVVYTYFFSHRWLRGAEDPPNPDGYFHLKAKALAELGRKEYRGYEYFYWIDFTCIDQERWVRHN